MVSARPSTLNFEQASQPFIDAGIPGHALIPIAPLGAEIAPGVGELQEKVLGKAPGKYDPRRKNWRGLFGGFLAEGVPAKDQDSFLKWPTPNVGILGRFFPGVDSDAVTEEGRRVVEEAIAETFGSTAPIAERLRGKGPRRLYAFAALAPDNPDERVRTRHIAYKLKGDKEGSPPQKLDVIGYGAQYLIAGDHQSGDRYRWHQDYDLRDLAPDLLAITNADVERFLDVLRRKVEGRGGEWLRSTGGRAPGEERDYSDQEPVADPADLLDGLKAIVNDEAHFPEREQAVGLLGNVRAAFGFEAEQYEEEIRDWFTGPGFADEDYFWKIWRSLAHGQRCSQTALLTRFTALGNPLSARQDFDTDHDEEMAPHREKRKSQKHEAEEILQRARSMFAFGVVNTREGVDKFQMRRVFECGVAFPAEKWWAQESLDPDTVFLDEIQELPRYTGKAGLYPFLRDLKSRFPDSFFSSETRNPNYDRGEIVPETQQDGSITHAINMRFMSQALRSARQPTKNAKRDKADVAVILEFMGRLFGGERDDRHVEYELDTLAYMLQTGKRPGHLLFLVGDQGVGKSIYLNALSAMFDGIGKDQGGHIDGTKITSESARRFALAKVEGCRIISVKELPDGSSPTQMANILSTLKQVVDAGPDADWIQIERKGKDSHSVQNFARIVISSNYTTAIPIEDQDRRTFYVVCGINEGNKPDGAYYGRVVEVTTDPHRLAAFVRYLMDRDVSHYKPAAAPPMTVGKVSAQIAGKEPVERHALAALQSLRSSGRWIFDMRELVNVMRCMAENEAKNTGTDDRAQYDYSDKVFSASVSRFLKRDLDRLGSFKTTNGKGRLPAIYAFRNRKNLWERMSDNREGIIRLLDDNRDEVPRLDYRHPLDQYQGFASTEDED